MIKYVIAALPRSGTAWLSALLSTNDVPCVHEAASIKSIEEWAAQPEPVGICDTSLFLFPRVVNSIKAPTLIIDRDHGAISDSLEYLGLWMDPALFQRLERVRYDMRIQFTDLFTDNGVLEGWLSMIDVYVSPERLALFREMNIQNQAQIDAVHQTIVKLTNAEPASTRAH
jgi:hypothetical protein